MHEGLRFLPMKQRLLEAFYYVGVTFSSWRARFFKNFIKSLYIFLPRTFTSNLADALEALSDEPVTFIIIMLTKVIHLVRQLLWESNIIQIRIVKLFLKLICHGSDKITMFFHQSGFDSRDVIHVVVKEEERWSLWPST